MQHAISCFRCGNSLSALSLPFSRRDTCPSCGVELRVCRMCVHYDPAAPQQCREDDAEHVKEKELANFCEWYLPSETAFDAGKKSEADRAREELEALFSGMGAKDD